MPERTQFMNGDVDRHNIVMKRFTENSVLVIKYIYQLLLCKWRILLKHKNKKRSKFKIKRRENGAH